VREQRKIEMTPTSRRILLRANAVYLLGAAGGGMAADLLGIFLALGPQSKIIGAAPHAGIGFAEAHGLAFIIGLLLWRAEPVRLLHLTAAAAHVLLGTANLAFWPIFVAADALPMGYVTTCPHWLFVMLHLVAVTVPRRTVPCQA
jgi:hypothetical protein